MVHYPALWAQWRTLLGVYKRCSNRHSYTSSCNHQRFYLSVELFNRISSTWASEVTCKCRRSLYKHRVHAPQQTISPQTVLTPRKDEGLFFQYMYAIWIATLSSRRNSDSDWTIFFIWGQVFAIKSCAHVLICKVKMHNNCLLVVTVIVNS